MIFQNHENAATLGHTCLCESGSGKFASKENTNGRALAVSEGGQPFLGANTGRLCTSAFTLRCYFTNIYRC